MRKVMGSQPKLIIKDWLHVFQQVLTKDCKHTMAGENSY